MAVKRQPVVLVILDGWGVAVPSRGNAIDMAKTPVYDELIMKYPTTVLQAAGDAVGLPYGEMGNSEVGHLSMGTGRIIYQDLPRIMKGISDGTFFENQAFLKAIEHVKKNKSTFHIVGMFSSGGVHSANEHGHALIELCAQQKLSDVAIHVILDGRDTAQDSGKKFVEKLQSIIKEVGVGRIATIAGRYFSMDRDNRWDRVAKSYRAMVMGEGVKTADPLAAIDQSYEKNVFDEQLEPVVITDEKNPPRLIKDGDAAVFFNFRSDRARQLTKTFVLPGFTKFDRGNYLKDLLFVTMTEYDKDLPVAIAYPPVIVENSLAKVLSDAGIKQLHIAETEKYAHVSFFFNGGQEKAWPGEERALIPSPMVASYDQTPAMGSREITDRLVRELKSGQYGFVVVNYANADMVGHTGSIESTVKAVEVIDECLGRILKTVLSLNWVMMITADHGNAEDKINPQTGFINKEHTANPVPLILASNEWQRRDTTTEVGQNLATLSASGVLADVAPTILDIMGLTKPPDMTGRSLLNILVTAGK
ncbi:MAG: 2,3-bisphosphoglycerate-independent phosphoglycerate mutase [Patescibacteria group bacterium]